MVSERTQFKGNDILVLKRSDDDKYPVSFGLSKAKLILEHIDDIQDFVREHEEK